MSTIVLLSILINFFSGAIAIGLAIMLLWQNYRSRHNLLLALFESFFGSHALAANVARLSPELEINLEDALQVSGMLYITAVIFLLLFNVEFIEFPPRIKNGARLLAISVGGVALVNFLLTGGYTDIYIAQKGEAAYSPMPLTTALIVAASGLMLSSAYFLWRSSKKGARELAWAMMLIPFGFVGVLDQEIFQLPSLSIVMIIIGFLAARVIMRLQVFDPLAQANERLKTTNAELEAYAHTVAHDLKNPLGGVIGYATLLRDEPSLSAKASARVESLIHSSRKMQSIIDNLLLLSQVFHRSDVEIAPLDMETVVEDSLRRFEYQLQMQQARVKRPARWHVAQGYAPWVEEIWANYLSNAVKYGGSPLEIELGSERLADGHIRFWVKDNGRGISPEQQASLFKEFARLSEHAALEGQGLGLSIVQRIASKLNGRVGVESEPEVGSVFYFVLPGPDG